jgi:DNA-binding Lrp family transcriptional regulator
LGGVYNSRALGYISRLCAGVVPEDKLDDFAAVADKIPAITHNYVRSHAYNVWFTVIARSEAEIQELVRGLEAETALHDAHVLSASRKFKINTVMGKVAASAKVADPVADKSVSKSTELFVPSEKDCHRINLLSKDIPHTLTPFSDLGIDPSEIRGDLDHKIMRRFGAVLRHQDAGFVANSMVCLAVTQPVVAGAELAALPFVSHCYERNTFEGFPYNLYAMVHAQSGEELEKFVGEVARIAKAKDYARLDSLRELKKTSYVYFA